jgi:hypothetical protein
MGKSSMEYVRKFFHPYLLPLKALFFFQLGGKRKIKAGWSTFFNKIIKEI